MKDAVNRAAGVLVKMLNRTNKYIFFFRAFTCRRTNSCNILKEVQNKKVFAS